MKMDSGYRLPEGGRIDRSCPLSFKFNGKRYAGYLGDTLASALLANGVQLIGRSLKYHRPRGVMSAGIEEANAIVQLCGDEDEPNAVATVIPLREGLEVKSVNSWPTLRFDFGAINEFFNRLLPAGFYYKTFMWPRNFWNFYGYFVRRFAAWSKAPTRYKSSHEERYEHRYYHCDVLVIGAGPSGIAATLAAGHAGARVLWVDNQPEPGGDLLNRPAQIEGKPASAWIRKSVNEIDNMPEVVRLSHSIASGYYDHNLITVLETNPDKSWVRERLWKVRAKQVVLATGAFERPLVFANNDRPGVMLASAACTYVYRYAVKPGHKAIIFTNNNSAYEAAFFLAENNLAVAAIVDVRADVSEDIKHKANKLGIKVFSGYCIKQVKGKKHVYGVEIGPRKQAGRRESISCDLICVSGGWDPTIHLHSQSGARPEYAPGIASFVTNEPAQQEISAGACSGVFPLEECLREGFCAGASAARKNGFKPDDRDSLSASTNWPLEIEAVWEVEADHTGGRAFLDLQNDVTSKDLKLAVRENFASVELVKRYTTAGMGIDQGKSGNVNVVGLLSELTGKNPGEVGTTSYRPSYSPISFGAMAGADRGDLIVPLRQTPITPWFIANGAYMAETGANFRRPYYIPRARESAHQAVQREAIAVRSGVGIYDGTPLGKIEINGPDAITFLNRVYTNSWETLQENNGRFGFMVHDDGRLLDDGVTFKLANDHYFMSTGSGVAEVVLTHLERLLACEWDDLDVYLTPVTDQWAVICVCGPQSREFLSGVITGVDLAPDKFKFMEMRRAKAAAYEIRLSRVGYTGELSYEIHIRARDGLGLWEALMKAGKDFGITPVGSETSMLLRTEKGFIATGLEGVGSVNLYDVGMGWVVNNKKGDFIGQRSMQRDLHTGGDRLQVVGLLPEDIEFVPPRGSPIVNSEAATDMDKMIGHVTVGCFSPSLKRSIALAQLNNGRNRMGELVEISTRNKSVFARVVEPIFVDTDGERMRS